MTHFVVKLFALILEKSPDINGRITFGKYVVNHNINIGVLVNVNEGQDLASILVEDANLITFSDLSNKIASRAKNIRSGNDDEHKKRTKSFTYLHSSII